MKKPAVVLSAFGLLVAGLFFAGLKSNYKLASSDPGYRATSVTSAGFNVAQNAVAPPPSQAASTTRTAVVHAFTLQMPADEIEAIYLRHLDECARLGCIVVSSHLNRSSSGPPYANASIRINPASFAAFEKILTQPPVHVVTHSQASDDKAIAFLDLEKRIDAKVALRDRLMTMLKEPVGKSTTDLLSVERELTQVQGDIESASAQRDYLRTITETVRLDISYMTIAAPQGAVDLYASQFKQTFLQSGGVLLRLFAGLVTLLVAALPWAPLVALLAWGGRRAMRRWHAARA
jgi:hypothetical protein